MEVPHLAENKNPLLQSVHIFNYLKCVDIFLGHRVVNKKKKASRFLWVLVQWISFGQIDLIFLESMNSLCHICLYLFLLGRMRLINQ